MSKAVLVLDEMPTSCSECDYMATSSFDGHVCILKVVAENYKKIGNEIKPDWCPLRELPEKMNICGKYPQPNGMTPSYKIGWNDCLNEITGEREG